MQHDFDFLFGSWTVDHRRLKQRLAHSNDWETFDGTCVVVMLLGGLANVDDNVLQAPAGEYRAASLRAFDSQTGKWSIWWLDGRTPSSIDPAVVGSFQNGIGTFYANDTYQGKPIQVRFTWSEITADSAKWQQAFSGDEGKSWETNWIMLSTESELKGSTFLLESGTKLALAAVYCPIVAHNPHANRKFPVASLFASGILSLGPANKRSRDCPGFAPHGCSRSPSVSARLPHSRSQSISKPGLSVLRL